MKFLVADDHAIVRKGLVQLLQEEFPAVEVTEVANSNGVLEAVKRQFMDLILMDISMPGRNGIETLKQIRSQGIKTPVLIVTMHTEEQYAIRAFKAGASGFLNKEGATEELLIAVHRVLAGRKYVSYPVAEKLAGWLGDAISRSGHERLSDRELQVLQRIASGKTVSEIADEISLSANTISTYRARILEKLALQNNAELMRYAFDNGLV